MVPNAAILTIILFLVQFGSILRDLLGSRVKPLEPRPHSQSRGLKLEIHFFPPESGAPPFRLVPA